MEIRKKRERVGKEEKKQYMGKGEHISERMSESIVGKGEKKQHVREEHLSDRMHERKREKEFDS